VEKLAQAAQEIAGPGATVVPIPTDVTNEAEVTALFQRTLDLFHRLDILVNNAGVFDGGPLDELPVETWDKVMAANLRGPFLCTRAALRIMKPQGVGESSTLGASRHSGPA
jgi:NAD(P)-dependent dehydrogenase (short-subunit alcohol dehydrogenase family)